MTFVRTEDDQPCITRACAELEGVVGSPRGRKFYGVFDPVSPECRACVERRSDDDSEALGLQLGIRTSKDRKEKSDPRPRDPCLRGRVFAHAETSESIGRAATDSEE